MKKPIILTMVMATVLVALARPDVLCVYYPHWHVYPKGNEWFHPGWTEWENVKSAKQRFPGHQQPIVPTVGYLDGKDPKDVAKEIDLAADAGIDVFLYDYYWYNGEITQQESIEEGFLKAPNRDRMKFALMWCYHERNWGCKGRDPKRVAAEGQRLMSLAHTDKEFLDLIDYSIAHYFGTREYYRKDGKLFFSIYNAPWFIETVGFDKVKAALVEARRRVRAAGLGEIEFNAQNAFELKTAEQLKAAGFDSLTNYNANPVPDYPERYAKGQRIFDYAETYGELGKRYEEFSAASLPYYPSVSSGWDVTPRCFDEEAFPWKGPKSAYPYCMTITNATAALFEKNLRQAKVFAENDPKRPGVVYINAWNEYTEGCYLLPDNFHGDSKLRAIENVFGRRSEDRLWQDFVNPSQSAKPWTYYFWSNSLTDKDTISEELADMDRLGFGGILLTDSRGYWDDEDHVKNPPASIVWGSDEWLELIEHTIREAARYNIKVTVNIAASGGHLRGDVDVGGDSPKFLKCRRYLPGDTFEQPELPNYREVAIFAVKTAEPATRGEWTSAGDGMMSMEGNLGKAVDAVEFKLVKALEVKELKSAAEGAALGEGWTIVRFGRATAKGCEKDIDVLDREAVVRHLERTFGKLVRRLPNLVGVLRTFYGLYNVSWEGSMPTWSETFEKDFAAESGYPLRDKLPLLAGFDLADVKQADFMRDFRRIRGKLMCRNLYGTVRDWAHRHGMVAVAESGGPWAHSANQRDPRTFGECDQIEFLAANDIPQGEFWPKDEQLTSAASAHANANERMFIRGIAETARRHHKGICSVEAFTHMHRHWSVDPKFLKPLIDICYADGINLAVWHTYTTSPAKYGLPGLEYFAGSHINRNVTWNRDADGFIKYMARCQSLLQQGEWIDDGEYALPPDNYYGWGRFRKDASAQFTTCHRRIGDAEVFFVAGEGKGELDLNCELRDRAVEVWDAVTGTRQSIAAKAKGGRTAVELELPVGGSCFVVVGGPAKAQPKARETARIAVAGPWSVSFAYLQGITAQPPAPMTMDALADWTAFDQLRHFSGTACYRTTVKAKDLVGKRCCLSLGKVPTGLAHVFINGIDCGVAWCEPFEVDISEALAAKKGGTLAIEIRYTNNWYNRLVVDCSLPENERVTKSAVRYWQTARRKEGWKTIPTVFSGPSSHDKLQSSGLLGPVELVVKEAALPVKRFDRTRLNIGAYTLRPYARTEAHVKDIADAGVDFVIYNIDRPTLDLFAKYGVGCMLGGQVPGWWGGKPGMSGNMWKFNPLSSYDAAAKKFRDHPAIWGIDIGDEPSALDFEHYGRVAENTRRNYPGKFVYLNLFPNYALPGKEGQDLSKTQLGARSYRDYVEKYCKYLPLDYLCYDHYTWGWNNTEAKMIDNLQLTADACTASQKSLWIVLQANRHIEGARTNRAMTVNTLRYQANAALAYGAETIIWACWTKGWWAENVVDTNGNRTVAYDRVKTVNRELHRLSDDYMRFRRVSTDVVGFGEDLAKAVKCPVLGESNGSAFYGVKATDGAPLLVGHFGARDGSNGAAIYVAACDDREDVKGSVHELVFRCASPAALRAVSGEGEVAIRELGDGRYAVSLASNRGVLICADRFDR